MTSSGLGVFFFLRPLYPSCLYCWAVIDSSLATCICGELFLLVHSTTIDFDVCRHFFCNLSSPFSFMVSVNVHVSWFCGRNPDLRSSELLFWLCWDHIHLTSQAMNWWWGVFFNFAIEILNKTLAPLLCFFCHSRFSLKTHSVFWLWQCLLWINDTDPFFLL